MVFFVNFVFFLMYTRPLYEMTCLLLDLKPRILLSKNSTWRLLFCVRLFMLTSVRFAFLSVAFTAYSLFDLYKDATVSYYIHSYCKDDC